MYTLVTLGLVTVFPVACMGAVLALGRLEETLDDAMRRDARKARPEPVRAVPAEPGATRRASVEKASPAPRRWLRPVS